MKKIRLFSTKATKGIEGEEAELYLNFYLVLNRNYIFTFLIDAPNLSCSGRQPIKLWKRFLIMLEEENVKYMRRYEKVNKAKPFPERKFEEIVVEYPPAELCTYPEYRGKPYFSIKYQENGEHIIGFGTYNPKVLSSYLRLYFMEVEDETD